MRIKLYIFPVLTLLIILGVMVLLENNLFDQQTTESQTDRGRAPVKLTEDGPLSAKLAEDAGNEDEDGIEIIADRTINSKTYYLGNNKYKAVAGTAAIHYFDQGSNLWQDIDTNIKASTNPEYDFENTTNNFKSFFKTSARAQGLVRYQMADSYITTSLIDNELGKVNPQSKGYSENNFFYYPQAYDDIDIRYSISSEQLLEEFIVYSYDRIKALDSLTQEIYLENTYFERQGNGSIQFFDEKTSQEIFSIPAPFMYELVERGNRQRPSNFDLYYEISQLSANRYLLKKVLTKKAKDWLTDPERIYPIVIDASEGPNNPGAVTVLSSIGTLLWTGAALITASNDSYSTVTATSGTTRWLVPYDFGFSIPSSCGTTIDGIKVEIERKRADADWQDNSIKINKTTDGPIGDERSTGADWPTTDTYASFGNSTDLWGLTWDYADINDTYFGVGLSATIGTPNGSGTAYVDHIRITVYYSNNVLPNHTSSLSINSGAASITLTEGTTTNVECFATIVDINGYEDITSVEAKFYRSGVGQGAADDDDNHYTVSGDSYCVPSNGSGNTEDYTCTIEVQFHADPTNAGIYSAENWVCRVVPSDSCGEGGIDTDDIEMNRLTALNVTSTIAYGELGLGNDTGSTDQTTTVTNTGNRQIDIQLDGYGAEDGDGYSMTCTVGTIAIGQERYDTATSTDWDSKTQLTDTAVTLSSFNLAKKTNGVSTKDVYWGFGLPATGVGGSCAGTVQFTAVSS